MYNDFYLQFSSKEDFQENWTDFTFGYPSIENGFVDEIGVILKRPLNPEDENEIRIPVPGYHINVRMDGVLPSQYLDFQIEPPLFPKRIWFDLGTQNEELTLQQEQIND